MIKFIGLRETPNGYRITELKLQQDSEGKYRKWADDEPMIYKRWNKAKEVCLSFYQSYFTGTLKYYGTINNTDFRGELATQGEIELFVF